MTAGARAAAAPPARTARRLVPGSRRVLAGLDRNHVRGAAAAPSAAVIPAITCEAGIRQCSSSTSISALVPAASPCRARAAAQNASWALVNAPAARAWASAAEPGSAPGLRTRISR